MSGRPNAARLVTALALALRASTSASPASTRSRTSRLEIRPHEVVGLIGENGAGKSTLMSILAGVYQPDAGEILLAGKPVRLRSAADATRQGIGMVFQEQSLLTNLTVGENIYLGNEAQFTRARPRPLGRALRRRAPPARQGRARRRPAHARRRPRLRHPPDGRARQGADARGAARRAISSSCSTSRPRCSSAPRSTILFERVRALKSRASFVFVSHRLDEVLELSRPHLRHEGRRRRRRAAGRRGRRPHAAPADGRPRPAGRVLPRAAAEALSRRGACSRPRGSACAGAYRDVAFSSTPARSWASPASSAPAARS